MLLPLVNEPRDYAWGSHTLLARLEGRPPADRPEAEVWFGDHPACPARTLEGTPLDAWLADAGATGAPARLPFLVKLLAAASPLSIQAHPSKSQAEAGFADEEAAGIPRDAPERTYRDDNHKPEVLVALSERFRALAGLRDLAATRRLVAALGAQGAPLEARLHGDDLAPALAWALAPDAADEVAAVVASVVALEPIGEFAAEIALLRDLARDNPADPGVLVALLMNLVTLTAGEALYLPAGVLHAYVEGLGVEVMATSDNVLRGGLTPKHVDVAGLLAIVDPRPTPPVVLDPVAAGSGVVRLTPGIPDFEILRVDVAEHAIVQVEPAGVAVAVCTAGEVTLTGGGGASLSLVPGRALLATPDEVSWAVTGSGTLYVAVPGRA
ncbi:mannose-6-phosphate isomerase, class I [Microbacterium awajiense]|uniref:mannose-6-phosphate isomerase n=1 Tax=Microbacterium awajiense TaxID=415214 RepID=A0ABP7ADG7_9MICO